MATLKLKKQNTGAAASSSSPKPDRAPVRGAGSGVKKRPTLAEAQAQRAEREARYQEQLRQRFGDAPPPPAFARRGNEDDRGAPPRRGRDAPPPARRQERGPAPDTRRTSAGPGAPRRDRPEPSPYQDRQDRPRRPDEGRSDTRARPPGPAASGGNSAFGARPAPRRDDNDRGDARHDHRRDTRAPVDDRGNRSDRGDRPERRPLAAAVPARPDPFREDQRRRGNGPDLRARAPAPQQQRRGRDDDDDEPYHAEQPGSMRLSKRMSELGMSSRREADEWIPKGWVRVDGRVVKELGSRVMPGQHISIDAKARNQQAARVTVLINKPVGFVSGQAEDGYEPAVVLVKPENQWREDHSSIHFLREHLRNLAPAGRLDIDSVGLLVLTQDGRIAKQLIGEDSDIEKEYLVRVHTQDGEPLPDSALALLNHGLELDGQALRPAFVEWVNDDQLRFVLKEGKKRQIRRMCEAVGLDVLGLKRVRIGNVMLGDLPPGQWRYLRGNESFAAAPVAPVEAAIPPQSPEDNQADTP